MKRMLMALLSALALNSAQAHHALEYIELESFNLSPKGEVLFYVQYDYIVENEDVPGLDKWEVTPGLAYGVTDRLLFDIHTHYAKFAEDHVVEEEREQYLPNGPSPFFEAVAMSLTCRITQQGPFHVAAGGGLELPFSRAETLLGSEDPVYMGTLILGHDIGAHGNVVLNIGYEYEGGEDEWSWGLGARSPLTDDPHGIAAGVEVHGDFDGERWSVIPGMYIPLRETTQLKIGFEIGREKDEGEWINSSRFSTAFMVKF